MKTLLAVGDSLMTGHYGASLLENTAAVQRMKLINRGQNGEPMRGILRNLQVHLRSREASDILLLDGGANDLLIPYMDEHHPEEWGPFFRKLARHGSVPVRDEEEFRKVLLEALESSAAAGAETILLLTIPCLGENLDRPLYRRGQQLNEQIRRIAREGIPGARLCLADLGRAFDDALRPLQPGSDWLFRSPADLEHPPAAEDLPARGLHVTIDGVHLNQRGAELAADVLDEALGSILSSQDKGGQEP